MDKIKNEIMLITYADSLGEKYTDVMGEIKNLDNGVPSFKEEGIKTNVDESINSNESSKGEGLSDVQDKYSINEEESKSTEDTKTNDL